VRNPLEGVERAAAAIEGGAARRLLEALSGQRPAVTVAPGAGTPAGPPA